MKTTEIIEELKAKGDPKNVKGMARFGINPKKAVGVSVTELRKMAKKIGKDHQIAIELWKSGIHEARILASMIDIAEVVREEQMEEWVKDFDSWGICDQVCMNLFDQTDIAFKKAFEWSSRKDEFVKRAGFSLMAVIAVHDKNAEDKELMKFFPIIKRESTDERNYVKKAVNWALRQIGKRNSKLKREAMKTAHEILKIDSKSARWIAHDAIRELR